ncbi:Proline-rich receptor-like protein kinase PERK9 [Camellia lanceoleosa]|uniref:Proline-rich receptor-like protein kinase PERK9 n=1 Tax=Camellia lanceoleosa TaxID=1840588 RepID=A0ACC0IHG1_9ERIC|nr:Proline-rich receptor-like protein kinase PERK9 [Camellia lanceoleosa]
MKMVVYEVLIEKKHSEFSAHSIYFSAEITVHSFAMSASGNRLCKIPKNNKNVTLNLTPIPVMMATSRSINGGMLSLLRSKTVKKGEIIVGLNSDNFSRELLLRLLTLVVMPGDNVLAVHVMEPNDTFDPNTFHIHEDLCKSKQVDFQVKVCGGDSYITGLTHQVRINAAKILAIGIASQLLPSGNGQFRENLNAETGTSQEGSARKALKSSLSSALNHSNSQHLTTPRQIQKSLTMPSSSKPSPLKQVEISRRCSLKTALQLPDLMTHKSFQRLAILETKGSGRRFTSEELCYTTNNFSPEMVIGEGGNSKVYLGRLDNGQPAAVKVLKNKDSSTEDLFCEVETSSCLKHENIVELIGYCYSNGMHAIVYNLLKENLNQRLKQLRWSERVKIAIGVAKALEYLHSRPPPIIHRDVKSSNILLSENCQPQLSDFGAAIVQQQTRQVSGYTKPLRVVGTFGYLAPEYMMYGRVDEKTDVYSYGVVLLELITGKEAIQTSQTSTHESLVLWGRSLLSCGLCERLIDPYLKEDYDKDEMKTMMIAARLCLLHSSSRRPTMKTILHLFEEPEQWLKMQRKREELLNGIEISSKAETGMRRYDDSDSN